MSTEGSEQDRKLQPLATRQWSCETLKYGMSFLNDQKKKESLEYNDILEVPWLINGFEVPCIRVLLSLFEHQRNICYDVAALSSL